MPLTLLCACAADAPLCPAGGSTLTIGTGERAYADLGTGTPELTLVHGPQGGFHLNVGLSLDGIDDPDDVDVRLSGTVQGDALAEQTQRVTFRCDPPTQRWLAWGIRLLYNATPEQLAGRDTEISASIDDLGLSATTMVQIVDPLFEETP